MWYYCVDCGHLFEPGEERTYDDVLDMIEGVPYRERRACCPVCGGDFEEADTCHKCGGAFAPDALVGRLYCRECLDEFMTEETMKRYISEDLENFAEWIFDGGLIVERNCDECIWSSPSGCTEWDCKCVTRSEARKIIEAWEKAKKGGATSERV